ncbi:MAG TPA: hypothetical protein VM581_01070 [Magnetospirillaceae bacterium]|nr:hypothetical protein [Magnetospirillaceae bacterium]
MSILPSIEPSAIAAFQQMVWSYYRAHKRAMPWRNEPTPYFVLVSELMLQQTQVVRVHQKFATFIHAFPTIKALAEAPLSDVLKVWIGLGYNRRAKFLWDSARMIVADFGGEVPGSQSELTRLPGIGTNTAGAILAYAFNEPAVFIETNIRTAFIHHFFNDNADAVDDDALRQLVAQALPIENPREWYWALMDYGTHLKSTVGAQLHRVSGYKTQSRFEGSNRQIRGQVLKALMDHKHVSSTELAALIPDTRLAEVCQALSQEGLISSRRGQWHLTDT